MATFLSDIRFGLRMLSKSPTDETGKRADGDHRCRCG